MQTDRYCHRHIDGGLGPVPYWRWHFLIKEKT